MKKLHLFASLLCVLTRKVPPLPRGGGRRPEGFGPRGFLCCGRRTYLVLILLFAAIANFSLAAGGNLPGTGTEADPYLIEDVNDFDAFANPANAATYWAAGVHTQLATDIDLSGRTYQTAVIAPDGSDSFKGVFDGDSHTIGTLTIDTVGASNYYLGLFGKIATGGAVRNLGLIDVNIDVGTGERCGGLVGEINGGGTILNCYVQGNVSGDNYVGGLVGNLMNTSNTIEDCYSTGHINGNGWVGGLIGIGGFTSIENCHSTATVTGGHTVGGLMGMGGTGDILACYANGAVSGTGNIGGLAGVIVDSDMSNCYATGDVTGTGDRVGGLIGGDWGSILNCYATGDVTGDYEVGGFVGATDRIIHNSYSTGSVVGTSNVGAFIGAMYWGNQEKCFWNSDFNSGLNGIGNTTDPNVMGVSTSEMQTQSTFAGWDFSDDDGDESDWMMLRLGEDYPRLAWQEVFMGDIAGLYGVDLVDFAYLANYWGLSGCNSGTDCGRADIDESGTVDLPDLAAIATDWLK